MHRIDTEGSTAGRFKDGSPAAGDAPTVVDDESFLPLIGKEKNLPDFLKEGLPKLYH